jgi:hypothetical protein
MISEKAFAAVTAAGMMGFGRSPQGVLRHYRSRVRASERRLSRRKDQKRIRILAAVTVSQMTFTETQTLRSQ